MIAVAVTISTWRARVWITVLGIVAPLIGRERAERWAVAGAWRLCRYRIGRGRWTRFDTFPPRSSTH